MPYERPHKSIEVFDWGLISFQKAWERQTTLFEQIVSQKLENRKRQEENLPLVPTSNYLVFCQHPHVYTLGKSGKETNLLLKEEELEQKQIDFYHINRGGDITYHGPGQLVGYPILDLENFFTDIHRYMRSLEEVIIRTLADFGILAERYEGLTGVWIGVHSDAPRKICAMGVKTSRWVTMHGFALNINPNLDYFRYIIPCGIKDKAVTSMALELGKVPPFQEVQHSIEYHFREVFEIR
ncbi:MAG: lipoyl(octanoyl) transferase LipB [Cytophagales bacterium]|nr:lipoyl(octanoyl) transferase LipB [Cytophagales bacterium]MDW8384810.1 lipoyl(octanoyl) transferase LipB [Flammeovirgaceae bacterium]